ncbi:MAG: thiamine pyrophosphate-binding protein [bacterium]|nr:thiamine pyrophosphate-binding protein [bacterium]
MTSANHETMTGGELVGRMLRAEGVEVVFGIIDGTYLQLNKSLRDHGIRLITPRHESSALHMAGAYARTTGKLGVCIASNGPGVANALPGVAVEQGEGNRVLLITTSRRTGIIRPDRGGTYQHFDQVGAIGPMSKWSSGVDAFDRVAELMRRALRESFRGRPGVVHLDVPEDLMNGEFEATPPMQQRPDQYRRTHPAAASPTQVREAADLLCDSGLTMIHAGSGIGHALAHGALLEVATLLNAPVTTSWAGRGAIPESLRLAIPMIHIELNNRVRNEADVVLSLGTRFGETDWWGKPPYWRRPSEQRHVQVDIDEQMLGLNKPVDLAVLADAGTFLAALRDELKQRDLSGLREKQETWLSSIEAERKQEQETFHAALELETERLHTPNVPVICQQVFDDDALLVIDGGNTAVWANTYHEVRHPLSVVSTFKFGMLGAGIPQALGAQIAHPGRQVYCIIGDGAMGFHPQEIETAIRNELPVVYIVICDRQWGMVKLTQQITLKPEETLLRNPVGPEGSINADLGEIRFDELARSMGAHGERVSCKDELEPALRRCIDAGRCAVVHVDVDPQEHLWAPGLMHFKAMHQEPEEPA